MSLDGREFRDALGSFTTGVCIITANPEGYEPIGITINSFASVSLEPALILWSLQNNSECMPAFDTAEKFAVNILSVEQKHLSSAYAAKGNHRLNPDDYRMGLSGTPVLLDVIASFECDTWARYPGGDHQIVLGEVSSIDFNRGRAPLLFSSGQYGELR